MRSLSITALMILAAFALGLVLGGELPRTVSAQDEPEEILWDYDRGKLSLFNQTDDQAFLIRGRYDEEGGAEVPPAEAYGVFTTYVSSTDEIVVYKLQAELMCDPRECRRCNGQVCPAPPWPPLEDNNVQNTVMGPLD